MLESYDSTIALRSNGNQALIRSSRHLGQYKGNFHMMDEVLIADLPPTEAPVTRMRFQIVMFSYRCVFKSIYFGLRISNVCVFIIVFIVSVQNGEGGGGVKTQQYNNGA